MVALLLGQLDLALLRGELLVGDFQFQQQLGIEVLDHLAVADVDDEALEKLELAGIIEDSAADLADPERLADLRHDAIVDVPVAARLKSGVDGRIDGGEIIRMDGRNILAHRVVDEIARRIAADGENAVADIEHGVGLVVAAAVEIAVHAAGNAEQRIQALVVDGPLAEHGCRIRIVFHSRIPMAVTTPLCPKCPAGTSTTALWYNGRILSIPYGFR